MLFHAASAVCSDDDRLQVFLHELRFAPSLGKACTKQHVNFLERGAVVINDPPSVWRRLGIAQVSGLSWLGATT